MIHQTLTRTAGSGGPFAGPRAFPARQVAAIPAGAGHDLGRIAVAAPARPAPVPTGAAVIQRADKRPGFTSNAKKAALRWHNTRDDRPFEVDEDTPDLPSHNAAMPHRFSWKDIEVNTNKFHKGKEKPSDFKRWTGRFEDAGEDRIAQLKREIAEARGAGKKSTARLKQELLTRMQASQAAFAETRDSYAKSRDTDDKKEFLNQANSFHANVPDLGPHRGVNNPVREAGHLHFVEKRRGRKRKRSPSPMSRRVLESPERLSRGLAFQDDEKLITTTGETMPLSDMSASTRKLVGRFPKKVVRSFDEDAPFGATSSSPPRKKQRVASPSPAKPSRAAKKGTSAKGGKKKRKGGRGSRK